ncbi:MAG: DUF4838 domain-containing protein, partial [Clostridia bacterium]|nr:DUF4838 domain-containing protein [Clostridia bacterium]
EHFHPHGIHTFGALSGTDESSQPCLNDEDTYQKMLATAMSWIKSEGSHAIHVSQNDNKNYCRCDKCQADINYYGSPAGSIIKLVNRMDEDFKAAGLDDITIITFAYAYSFPCPKNIKCNDDIAIEICTINNCYNHAYNDPSCPISADCMKQIDAWGEICDEFYIWDYTVDFKYYLSPFPNFDVLLDNLRYLGGIGARGYLAQGNYQAGKSAEFADLRCYLIAKVLENPNMTNEEYYAHMDEFLAAYYGEGWEYVRKFIDLVTDMSNEKNFCFNLYSSPEEMFGDHAMEPYNETLIEWWDKAEELAGTDIQLEHVRRSRLCCDYLRIGAIHYRAYGENMTTESRNEMRAIVKAYLNELKELGVTRIAENFPIPGYINQDWNPRNWWSMHYYEE